MISKSPALEHRWCCKKSSKNNDFLCNQDGMTCRAFLDYVLFLVSSTHISHAFLVSASWCQEKK